MSRRDEEYAFDMLDRLEHVVSDLQARAGGRRLRRSRIHVGAPAVYEAHGERGLLYIGSTGNLARRLGAHAHDSAWWAEAWRIDARHYPTLSQARQAERLAIEEHQPPWNRTHTDHLRRQRAQRALDQQ